MLIARHVHVHVDGWHGINGATEQGCQWKYCIMTFPFYSSTTKQLRRKLESRMEWSDEKWFSFWFACIQVRVIYLVLSVASSRGSSAHQIILHRVSRTHCELGIIKRTFLNLILMNSIKMFTVTLTQVSNPKDYCLQ